MNYPVTNLLQTVSTVEKHLTDEMSRKIYEMRLKYSIYGNSDELHYDILNLGLKWHIPKLDDMYKISGDVESLIIFGCGADGKSTLGLLKNSKYKNEKILFCDNDNKKWGKPFRVKLGGGGYEIPVISPAELFESHKNSIVIVGSSMYKMDIFEQVFCKYPWERILLPAAKIIHGYVDGEYFDYFEPNENEIFIDGGCYDGQTAVEFANWARKGYDYIYSFETTSSLINKCKKTFVDNKLKGEVFHKGLWDKKSEFYVKVNPINAMSTSNNINNLSYATERVETVAIDEILNGKRVSFIKLDIEGAEYKALVGARKTIEKWRPRMAICIYHKPEDIFELPNLLLEMHSDYKFTLRQYHSWGTSTILYVW